MNVAEVERLLRLGMCSPGRHAEVGCATCDRCEEAIAAVHAMAFEVRHVRLALEITKVAARKRIAEAGGAPDARTGVNLIAGERARQLAKWGAEHDAEHRSGDLAVVAAALAVYGTDAKVDDPLERVDQQRRDMWGLIAKHGGSAHVEQVKLLTIAGALIAAEIDRMLAKEPRT